MQFLSQNRVLLEKTLLIDWYDGVITSLVKLQNGGWMLSSLLAFQDKTKIVALIPLSKGMAEDMEEIIASQSDLDERWELLQQRISQIKQNHSGNIYLLQTYDLDKGIIKIVEVAIDEKGIRSMIGSDIELIYDNDAYGELSELFAP